MVVNALDVNALDEFETKPRPYYIPGEKLEAFKDNVITHNDLTFSMYTDK